MATTTAPILLDSTGQQILSKLEEVSILPQIVDNLTTSDATKALSAKQGKVLNDAVTALSILYNTMFKSANYMVSNGLLYRIGPIVFMTYTGDFKNIPGGEFSFGQIVPTGYRPVNTLAIGERNNGHLTLRIYSDGTINCYNYNEQAISLMNGQITACWITTDQYPTN